MLTDTVLGCGRFDAETLSVVPGKEFGGVALVAL